MSSGVVGLCSPNVWVLPPLNGLSCIERFDACGTASCLLKRCSSFAGSEKKKAGIAGYYLELEFNC